LRLSRVERLEARREVEAGREVGGWREERSRFEVPAFRPASDLTPQAARKAESE
jgi:hypothetical protein